MGDQLGGNSVTELNAATGALVQVINDSSDGFSDPARGISSDGSHVWVASEDDDSVTQLDAATGALVQVINGDGYEFNSPDAISSDGTHVWVTNYDDVSVTELDAATGALVQVINGPASGSTCRRDLLRRHPRVGGQRWW